MSKPLRYLSLGAGVQSSTLALLSAKGEIPRYDAMIFADTGWEPPGVYAHLQRIVEEIAKPAGIPVMQVSAGNIRSDALDPEHRFASMPLFVRNPDGSKGMARRQCTSEYKIKPIKQRARELLAAAGEKVAEQSIGISTDEFGRAKDADVKYMRNVFPLIDLGLSRKDCTKILTEAGFPDTPKSACIGCPFHGNRQWRDMRDNRPEEFADAVAFDAAIRNGSARANANGSDLLGQMYLHRSLMPLDQAPIDKVTYAEWIETQRDAFDDVFDLMELGDPDGCSPWACRSGSATEDAPLEVGLVPIAGVSTWEATMEAADWQCQCSGGCGRTHVKEPGGRCRKTHRGGYRLVASAPKPVGNPYKDSEGPLVAYCYDCYDGHRRAATRSRRNDPGPREPLFDVASP